MLGPLYLGRTNLGPDFSYLLGKLPIAEDDTRKFVLHNAVQTSTEDVKTHFNAGNFINK